MSNKFTLVAVTLLTSMTLTANAADEAVAEGIHPYKDVEKYAPEISNWSIFVDAGFSHFDGDNGVKLKTAEQMSFDGGLGLEYTFTPLWGIFAEWHTTTYGQHMFDKSMTIGEEDIVTGGRSLGHLNTVGLGIDFNLTNAFFPRRKHNLFNLYAQVGGGAAVYQYHGSGFNYALNQDGVQYKQGFYQKEDGTLEYTDNRGHNPVATIPFTDAWTDGKGRWQQDKKTNVAGYIFGGVLASFNITRTFELGLRAYYDYFLNDYVDGGTSATNRNNKNNDGNFGCDMEFRFNILAKQKSHTRNISNLDAFYAGLEEQEQKDMLENWKRQKDTLVISHKDTLVAITKEKEQKVDDRHFYIYFDNNKDQVSDAGMITIQQVAALLQRDTNLCAEITGYCDNTGNVEYNKALSKRRADNVLSEFTEEYDFSGDRAYTVSRGIIVGKRSKNAFGPNRRVDIHIVDKEKFVEMKAAHEAELKAEAEKAEAEKAAKEQKAEPVAQAEEPVAAPVETVKKAAQQVKKTIEEVADEAEKKLSAREQKKVDKAVEDARAAGYTAQKKIVTVKEGETLSKIARREYGNTQCWVYIYEANAIRLNGASNVRPGMVLFLPTLTDEQMAITKDEAHTRYEAHK